MTTLAQYIDAQIEKRIGTDHQSLKRSCTKAVCVWTIVVGYLVLYAYTHSIHIFEDLLTAGITAVATMTGYVLYRMHVLLIMTSPSLPEEQE